MKVGGEIEAYCTSCKAIHWHIIIAMVDARPAKVECLSCHKQHTLRTARSRARGAAAPAPSRPATVLLDLEEKLRGREKTATGYDPERACALDEVIRHPSFGLGVVVALPAPQRMEVAFHGGRKFLVHDRAGGGPRLKRPDAHAADEAPRGASDAPPAK
ncbi:MAG: hypothetical protein HY906_23940 [Deltaproteobacteria bacterium]|nr:hypothetical protein [Deltaproteobacteria bacterium]